ncbi:hypothetical protein [Sinosporangium siamense]|uniref:Uncharacterized protein n=1 Tax=Sinosporangium siamense TaxID=1367973 RepID=A0A919V8F2_9ACTN|nr:hypothetical protein [Sinosporangium siamense]GII93167.1 hypothetical protein Ssi02_33980 [Sinosporangium siamense]
MDAGMWVMIGLGIVIILALGIGLVAIVLKGISGPDRQWPVR